MRTNFFLPLFFLILFFAVLFIGVKNQSQSWYFQDETEHVTVGWMVTDHGRQLYHDLSTNHQPLPILVGAALAKVIPYNTLFEFIDRLKMSMWLFALLSSVVIVIRFRWRGLASVILTYSLGHYYFAWHVLAESLVIPAVIWILLSLLDRKYDRLDAALFGLSTFWITFNLIPLWPFLALVGLYLIVKTKFVHWQIVGAAFLIPTFILFFFINPFEWWQETIVNNVIYFIPYEAKNDSWHYVRMIFYPLLHLSYPASSIARFYVVFLAVIGAALVNYRQKILSNKKTLFIIAAMFGLLLTLNPRVSTPDLAYYRGFHLFPYIAGVSVILSHLVLSFNKKIITALVIAVLLINNLGWVWEKKDKLSDYYIQYDTFQAYGTALKTLSRPGETLMTGPNGSGYMNMMANLPLAGDQNFHLEWAYRVPYQREKWLKMFENNPPTFIYYNLSDDSYSQTLKPIIESEYVTLVRTDGTPTQLRMNKNAAKSVSAEQWEKFKEQSFRQPTL